MTKYTSELEFIGILQFGQKHLILEINFSKEIEKMIAKNFHETLMCSFECIFSTMIAFKPLCNHFLSAVMLFAIFCNHPTVFALTLVPVPWPPLTKTQSVNGLYGMYCRRFKITLTQTETMRQTDRQTDRQIDRRKCRTSARGRGRDNRRRHTDRKKKGKAEGEVKGTQIQNTSYISCPCVNRSDRSPYKPMISWAITMYLQRLQAVS